MLNVRGQAGRGKRVRHATEHRTRPCLHRACWPFEVRFVVCVEARDATTYPAPVKVPVTGSRLTSALLSIVTASAPKVYSNQPVLGRFMLVLEKVRVKLVPKTAITADIGVPFVKTRFTAAARCCTELVGSDQMRDSSLPASDMAALQVRNAAARNARGLFMANK
jgi:hypothetical protein